MNILKTIGKIGKGFATIAGAVLGVGGVGVAVANGNDQIASCVSLILSQPEGAIMAVGGVLLLFGYGRKAGFIAGKAVTK